MGLIHASADLLLAHTVLLREIRKRRSLEQTQFCEPTAWWLVRGLDFGPHLSLIEVLLCSE